MKTQEEIQAEIQALTDIKPKVRQFSGFGDDHHEAIDAQIAVLTGRMAHDDIYDSYGDESADEFAQNVLDAAIQAHEWMLGRNDEVPSSDWQSLL